MENVGWREGRERSCKNKRSEIMHVRVFGVGNYIKFV